VASQMVSYHLLVNIKNGGGLEMLCEKCKVREANIRYTEVINGVASEHNLCSQCAREMDFGQHSGLAGLFDSDYPIGKILSQLLGRGAREEENQTRELENLVCPTCNTSYVDLVKNSEFGCPDCYRMFDLLIGDKLKQLHGSDRHTGKCPAGSESLEQEDILEKPISTEEEIQILRSRIQEAIAEEDYEAAARYRDEIRGLEQAEEEKKPKKIKGRSKPDQPDTLPQGGDPS
jgi:protein arginine kinase activator